MQFNALESYVKSELNDYSSRMATRITNWINECHRLICQKRRWRFLVIPQSDEMTFGTADTPVDIETDIKYSSSVIPAQNIISIYDTTDGTYKELTKMTIQNLRRNFPTSYSSEPEYWWYASNKEINFFPTLDQDRTFVFAFQRKVPTYTTLSTDQLLIPDEYVDVLKELVLYKAYRYKTDDRAGAVLENYNALLGSMVSAESNKDGIIYDSPMNMPERLPMLVDNS